MRVSKVFLFAVLATPLLGCAGTSGYLARAEAGRDKCSAMEGYPDCQAGQQIMPVAYEPAVDRTSIQDLQARYESAVASRDAGSLAALFTEDAILEAPSVVARGRGAIGGELTESGAGAPFLKTQHHVTNTVIHLDGLKATSTSAWFELNKAGPGDSSQVGRVGRYEDEFIKSGSTWLFVKRKIVLS